jgi:hypothetical protein
MSKRNLLIQVTDIGFYPRGEIWYRAHVFVADSAAGTYGPQTEHGGWDRGITGRLHPLEVKYNFSLPGRLIIDVEEAVRTAVEKAWRDLKTFNEVHPG